MSKRKPNFWDRILGDAIYTRKLEDWIYDYALRVDNGLYEIQLEYKKKKIERKCLKDAKYCNLAGKFHALLCLAEDFKLKFPHTDRINQRIKIHRAAK